MTLKQKFRQMIVFRIFLLAFVAILCAICAYIIRDKLNDFYMIGTIILSIVILVYVAFKSKLVDMLCDSAWSGTVTRVSVEQMRDVAGSNHLMYKLPPIIDFTVIEVSVEGADKPKIIKIKSSIIPPKAYLVGDTIIHHRGMHYPQNPATSEKIHICPVCGKTWSDNYCPKCHLNF